MNKFLKTILSLLVLTTCFNEAFSQSYSVGGYTDFEVTNNSKITFIVTDFENYPLINLILGKFNEENNLVTKKKKDKSFTKRKMKRDYQFFFDEIKQENTLYYASFIDIDAEQVNLQDENINEIFLNL